MSWVLATAGHVDHGKSSLVQALTGRDPDRLEEEKARGLTIELGFAWTHLPDRGDLAFVDVPGHQRFIATMLAGLGPSPAVLFVVAADQGWQAQSAEHLAAVQALGIRDGLLVVSRCDLAEEDRRDEVAREASARLAAAGLVVPVVRVSARSGLGMDDLRAALADLTDRLPRPDDGAPVRLWTDRSFSIAGAGTVLTGTLGSGTVRTGDRLTLHEPGRTREVVVRGLHSQDRPRESVGPISRVAVNLRGTDAGELPRSAVLLTPGAFTLASVVDVELQGAPANAGESWFSARTPSSLPDSAVLHVGSAALTVQVRPLGARHARLTVGGAMPWQVGDRALLRDPGSRLQWGVRVLDVDPLPLRRRGASSERGRLLAQDRPGADLRLTSRGGDHPLLLQRLALPAPGAGVRVGDWWFDRSVLARWTDAVRRGVDRHQDEHPLSAGVALGELRHLLDLPPHLRARADGGSLPRDVAPPGAELVRHLVVAAGLDVTEGRAHRPDAPDLGPAERGVAALEATLHDAPFAAPESDRLAELGLGPAELAAAHRTGRLLRLPDDVVLLPDAPARAMRLLAGLDQPFTLSSARQALGTTRRVAVPLLEHLDARGWTRRLDGRMRTVVR